MALNDKINLVAVCLMFVSLFGFLGNVMIDYNWGTNLVTSAVAVAYWMTLRWIIPFPLNYWGLGAVVYFILFLVSFGLLNRSEPPARNLLGTVRLASIILVLFELGVFYFVPGFMNKWVIQAFHDTPLGIITNAEVLIGSVCAATLSQAGLFRMRIGRMEES